MRRTDRIAATSEGRRLVVALLVNVTVFAAWWAGFAGRAPAVAQGTSSGWVGTRVIIVDGSPLKDGPKVVVDNDLHRIYVVQQVSGPWLLLRSTEDGARGWVAASSVVRYDQAIDHYTAEIRRNPTAESYRMRGAIWKDKGELDIALADSNEAIRLDPSSASAWCSRGNVWMDKREYDKAIADYDEAIKLKPNYVLAHSNRGNAWYNKQDYDRAIADYGEAIRLDPGYFRARSNRGDAWYNKEEYDKAIADHDEAIRLDPKYAPARTGRGNAWLAKGDRARALADYDEAIRLDRKTAYRYRSRGWVRYLEDQYDEAIADYDEAIKLNPKDDVAFYNRALAWHAQAEHDRAIADYSRAIELDPEWGPAYKYRGDAWDAKGDYERAIADFNRAAEVAPEDSDAYNSRAWFWATCPDAAYRDGAKAVESATRACELSEWNSGNDIDTLAAAYAEAGDFDKAVEWQEKAIELVDDARKDQYRPRLELYRAGMPYRQESTPPAATPEAAGGS